MSDKHISTNLDARKALLVIRDKYLPSGRLEVEISINDKRIKKFLRHQLIYEHLCKALEFLNACKQLGIVKKSEPELKEIEEKNQIAIFALTISAVMMYYKPFTKTGGPLSGSKLDPNTYFRNKPDIEKTHRRIREMRNRFIAHIGNSDNESVLAFLTFSSKGETSLEAEHLYKYSFDLDEVNQFKRLIKHLRHDIGIELEIEHDKFIKNLSPEEIESYRLKAEKLYKERISK